MLIYKLTIGDAEPMYVKTRELVEIMVRKTIKIVVDRKLDTLHVLAFGGDAIEISLRDIKVEPVVVHTDFIETEMDLLEETQEERTARRERERGISSLNLDTGFTSVPEPKTPAGKFYDDEGLPF